MSRWEIDQPGQVTFDKVSSLSVRIVAGHLAVLASDGPPTLEVSEIGTTPLVVSHEEGGRLTVAYKDLTWDGAMGWLRGGRRSASLTLTVPKDCPVQAGVVSASAVIAGFERRTSVKGVTGGITLDGLAGDIDVDTVSGDVEARQLAGDLVFKSVSGELTVAGGTARRLRATTVSGAITADLDLSEDAHLRLRSVSAGIVVRLSNSVQATVNLRSQTGGVLANFEGLDRSTTPGAKAVTGRIGGGGRATVAAHAVSGDVTLLRGEPREELAE